MSKLRIGVIFGGRSGEHEVSLVSAGSVIGNLDPSRYEVVPIGIAPDGRWISSDRALSALKAGRSVNQEPERFLVPEPHRQGLMALDAGAAIDKIDVIFPVVHGTSGEDGTLQGLLELANIPYVGAGVLGSALGMDKVVQKQLFEQAKLPIAKYMWFLSSTCRTGPKRVAASAEKSLRYPMFTKPANTGSSVGISKARNRKELVAGIETAAQYDRKIVIEQGVNNIREIECSVLGNDDPVPSTAGEIIPSNEFYDYDAKYVDGKSESVIPAALPKNVERTLQRLAVRAFRALDCAGMARVDFFVSKKSNRIYLNEINTIPGFTAISMYPKLWAASGLSYKELLEKLIALAIERHKEKNAVRTKYSPTKEWYRE